jgi:hypothetical protein
MPRTRPSARVQRLHEITGLSARVLHAIQAVESRGRDDVLRFEPHVFLRKRPDLEGRIPFTPKDPPSKMWSVVRAETGRLAFNKAFKLTSEPAVRSTSFGSYQVMGWALLPEGANPAAAVASFWAWPEAVSDRMFARWIQRNPSAKEAAKARNWVEFARIYNGAGQKEHYGRMIAEAWRAARHLV